MKNDHAIVLTGGPGMGKTSIIDNFEKQGYPCIPESGRAIIMAEQARGGNKLPWEERLGFAEAMFEQARLDYEKALLFGERCFFDRALPDCIGYLKVCQLPIPPTFWQAAKQYRYHNQVFITPPWLTIYENDAQRKQSFAEAVATYQAVAGVYDDLGYHVIEIPQISIPERAAFIVKSLATTITDPR